MVGHQPMNILLLKVLWYRRSKLSFWLAGLAYAFGLTLLLLTLDVGYQIQLQTREQKKQGQFLMVNKKISLVNTLGLASSAFSKEEIKRLKEARFVRKVGFVESNQFQATLRSRQIIHFSTAAFFEAIPNDFLEKIPRGFYWHEGDKRLPIVVSQDFLNLYNFGFALGQNLPQVSREALSMVPFEVSISGPGGNYVFQGEIVGFTERLSSVLVPLNFMRWANRVVAQKGTVLPSRALINVPTLSEPGMEEFLVQNRLVSNQDQIQSGKGFGLLQALLGGISVLGIFFLVLAIMMFYLTFRLILSEASQDIRYLVEMGYPHRQLVWYLLGFLSLFLVLLYAMAHILLHNLQPLVYQWMPGFKPLENPPGDGMFFIAGILFSALISLLIYFQVYRILRRNTY